MRERFALGGGVIQGEKVGSRENFAAPFAIPVIAPGMVPAIASLLGVTATTQAINTYLKNNPEAIDTVKQALELSGKITGVLPFGTKPGEQPDVEEEIKELSKPVGLPAKKQEKPKSEGTKIPEPKKDEPPGIEPPDALPDLPGFSKDEEAKSPQIFYSKEDEQEFKNLVEDFKKENNIKSSRDITYTDEPSSKGYQLINTIKNKHIDLYGVSPTQAQVNKILGGNRRKQIINTKIPLSSGLGTAETKKAIAEAKTSPEFIAKQVNKFQELSNKDKKLRIYKDNVITAEGDDYINNIIKRAESGTRRGTTKKEFLTDKQLAKKYNVSEDQIVKANQIIYANNEIKLPEPLPETFTSRVAEERLRKGYEKLSNWEKSNVDIQEKKKQDLNTFFSKLSLDKFKSQYPQILQDLKWKLKDGKPVLVERSDEKILKDLDKGIFSIEHGKNKATEEVDIQRLTNRHLTTAKNNNLIYSMEAYIRRNEGKSNPYINDWLIERGIRIKVDDKYYGASPSEMFNSNTGEHVGFNKALEFYGLDGDVVGPTKERYEVLQLKDDINKELGEGTITTADEAPEPDSSILRRLFEDFKERTGFKDGSPNPMEEMATLKQAIASTKGGTELKNQFLYDTSPIGKLDKNIFGKDGDRNLMQQFNTQFLDPRSYPYYAQKTIRGAANIPELAVRFPLAAAYLFGKGSLALQTGDLSKFSMEDLRTAMEILEPKFTKLALDGTLGDVLGLSSKAIQAVEEKRAPSQKATGDLLQFGAEAVGPATPYFAVKALQKIFPKLPQQIKDLVGSASAIDKVNKEIEKRTAVEGVDQTRRDIILATGAGGAVALLKLLGLDNLFKAAPKAVKATEGIVTKGGTPKYFFDFVSLIKSKGKDITDKASTLERQKVYDYNGYELTEDISTGKISIRKDTEGGATYSIGDGEYETVEGIVRKEEINYEPPETILDDAGKPKEVPDQYDESTLKPDNEGDLEDIDQGLDSIDEILDLLAKDGKKYSLDELKEMGINPEAIGDDFLLRILKDPSELKIDKIRTKGDKRMDQLRLKITGRSDKAGGGIMKIAGDDSGPPPKSGPTPHGLPYVAKNVRPIKERK